MQDLQMQCVQYIKQGNEAMALGDYDKAQSLLLRAAECTVALAKQSVGAEKQKHLERFNLIKQLLAKLIDKKNSVKIEDNKPSKDSTYQEPTSEPKIVEEKPNSDNGSFSKSQNSNYVKPKFTTSPQYLSDYIGQPKAVTAVRDLITAARLTNSAIPHLILYGSHGLGKTTFSRIIANELKVGFTEINASKITPTEMVAVLKKIQPRDILFIDEIHTVPLLVAESILYSAMQDGRVTYSEGKGKTMKTVTMNLPPFTLIGATTEIGKIAKPFTQRAIQIRLEEYTDEVLAGIISSAVYKRGMKISQESALHISQRCRNNPRIANNMVKRITDKALVRYAQMNNLTAFGSLDSVEAIRKLNIDVEQKVIDQFFEENGIDSNGLESGDRALLRIIIERYEGGPVGLDTLARVMNESNNVLAQKYEAYLIKKAMLKIDRDGRVVMPNGYKALGLPVPEKLLAESNTTAQTKEEEPVSKYEKRQLVASKVQDELKCKKVEELITYPENVKEITEDLASLFPDVEKPYDDVTKHRCELEIDFDDFKRVVICDSFLESRFAQCMARVGYLNDIKAQTLEIPYISQALANHRYFPDFVIRDYKNRIAIIEMKNFNMLSYHLNLDKYEQLKAYCEENGFGYAEIAKPFNGENYVSLDQLRVAPVNTQLENYIFETIDKNGKESGEYEFTANDFTNYCKQYGPTDISEVYTILINNRQLKNVDRVGDNIKIIPN